MLYPLDADCLHLHLDKIVVRCLVYRVCHNCVGDLEVPDSQLVELVAVSVGGLFRSQIGGKPGYGQEGVHFAELAVQVSSYYNLRACILLHYVLGQVNYGLCSLANEAFLSRFQVHVQDVHLLTS